MTPISSIPSARSTRIPSSLLAVLALSFLPIQALAKGGGGGGRGGGGGGRGGVIFIGGGGHSSGGSGSNGDNKLSTGAIIGIVLGCLVGTFLVASSCYWCKKRRTRAHNDLHDDDDDDDNNKDVLPMYQPSPAYPVLGMGVPESTTTTTHTPYPDISTSIMPPPNYDAPSSAPSAVSSPMPAAVYPVMPSPVFTPETPSAYPILPSPVPLSASPPTAYPVMPSTASSALYPPPSSPPPTSSNLPPMYPPMPVATPHS